MSDRQKGTVRWFNAEEGFGSIDTETGENLYVHYSSIQKDGFQNLYEGEAVTFLVEQKDNRRQACDVRPVP